MKKFLNFFQSFTTLCYQVVILFIFILLSSCETYVKLPYIDCDEIKTQQYSVIESYYKLILVETDKTIMFIPEDSDVWKYKIECCIRIKGDTITKCITCNDFVAFVNSQLTTCNIEY